MALPTDPKHDTGSHGHGFHPYRGLTVFHGPDPRDAHAMLPVTGKCRCVNADKLVQIPNHYQVKQNQKLKMNIKSISFPR